MRRWAAYTLRTTSHWAAPARNYRTFQVCVVLQAEQMTSTDCLFPVYKWALVVRPKLHNETHVHGFNVYLY